MSLTNAVMVELSEDERRRLERVARKTGEKPEHLMQRLVCDVFTTALDRVERMERLRRAAGVDSGGHS